MTVTRARRRLLAGSASVLLAGALVTAVGPSAPEAAAAAAVAGPALSIDVGAGRHVIPDGIYGASYPSAALITAARIPLARWGGNATTRYNYANNMSSTAADWFYENIPEDVSLDSFISAAAASGARAVSTVPVEGHVAASTSTSHPYGCSFPVSVYGTQQRTDPWEPGCGNGLTVGGQPITPLPSTTGPLNVAAGPPFVSGMVAHLAALHGPGGMYQLDNEPSLWNSTHRDVHPQAATYDEVIAKSVGAADAVRAADATGSVSGPGDWGWCAYFYSPADNCAPGADRAAHGNADFAAAYLSAFAAHDRASGVRHLDVFDEHWYPQAGVALRTAGDATLQALRLRQTRTLWDPTYTDESWTNDLGLGPVMLIPRMRAWAAQHYPGTGLAIGEYNFGGLESINGALAQADVLGIFGREGLTWAALWDPPAATDPGAFAFSMYRNLDGSGARFGDVSVQASSTDQGRLSVYAATRSTDGSLTVVVVNKTLTDLTSSLSVAGAGPLAPSAQVWRYSSADLAHVVRAPDLTVSGAVVSATYPASSITTLVLPPSTAPRVSLAVSRTVVPYRNPLVVTATAWPAVAGAPATLWMRPTGSTWRRVLTGTTGAGGRVSWTLRPIWDGQYVAFVSGVASPAVSVRVATVVTASPARRTVPRGAVATVGGTIRPLRSGMSVVVQRWVGRSWRSVALLRPSRTGTWGWRVRAASAGTYAYRAAVVRNGRTWAVSPIVRITMR